jgi:hypothetical protein
MDRDASAISWLLRSEEPAVRYLTRRDLLGEEAGDAARVLDGPKVRTLLSGQRADGGFGVHPYRKWQGAHWRLVSLVELAVPPGEPRAVAAAGTVLDWLTGAGHRRGIRVVDGLVRRCASQEGNALAVCCRLGLAADPRLELIAASLRDWQWPDGGWNCDDRASGRRSSFHESLAPMWGLHEHWQATGDERSRRAAERTGELFLGHRLFRATATGEPIHASFLAFHWPAYWHYDVLRALVVLGRVGALGDSRAADALDLVEEQRLPDGRWRPGGYWWRRPGSAGSNVEVVDWGRRGPNEHVTLDALRVLVEAGRVPQPSTVSSQRRPLDGERHARSSSGS